MAIPSTPSGFFVQTGNLQNLVSWDLSVGATSYIVQRSLDNVTYSTLATISGSPLATSYLDTAVSESTQYWYKTCASNDDGDSSYTTPDSAIPAKTAEMSLKAIRDNAKRKSDMVNSQFITTPEWNTFINLAMYELYDLLITTYEDMFVATPAQFSSDGSSYLYPLPNGLLEFTNGLNSNVTDMVARPFYKLLGVDQAINGRANAFISLKRFNFINRNEYIYPNSNSSLYGVFNPEYRVMGSNIELIPTPSANQAYRLWYIPRLAELLKDTDTTDVGVSGWIQYVIVRAALYALAKEESDTSVLIQELAFLKQRIEESASNRDVGQADTISNTRGSAGWGGGRGGFFGPSGGF